MDDDDYGICGSCGSADATLAPDPYRYELYDDATPVWLCMDCRYERALDI